MTTLRPTTKTPTEPAGDGGRTAWCAVTHGTAQVDLVDLLVEDDEWVRREFDAIVAAGWGVEDPPGPASRQGAHRPRRPGSPERPSPVRRSASQSPDVVTASARQRGPP